MRSRNPLTLRARVRGWAANLALLLTTLVLLVAIAEAATRLLADVETPLLAPHPRVGMTLLPNYRGVVYNRESEREVSITTNSLGFRGPDRSTTPAPGVRRIAVIGDSFIAALACQDEETLVVQLEELFRDSHPDVSWEVMNFGVSASSTAQELVLYREVVASYAPHLVIVAFFVGNDYQDNSEALSNSQRIQMRLDESGALVQRTPSTERKRLNAWLNRNSRFYVWQKEATRVLRISGPAAQVYRTDPDPVLDHAWLLTARILETFADEVRRNGSQFLLALLPTGEQVYDDMWEERAVLEEDVAGAAIDRDHPDRKLGQLAERAGIPLVVMTEAFRASADAAAGRLAAQTPTSQLLHFRGYGHFTPKGHGVAAGAIHAYLTQGAGHEILREVLAQEGVALTAR